VRGRAYGLPKQSIVVVITENLPQNVCVGGRMVCDDRALLTEIEDRLGNSISLTTGRSKPDRAAASVVQALAVPNARRVGIIFQQSVAGRLASARANRA